MVTIKSDDEGHGTSVKTFSESAAHGESGILFWLSYHPQSFFEVTIKDEFPAL